MMVPVNEAGEPCHISFYIIDLITDQIVYTALSSNYADHADHRFDQAWREMHNELIPILNQYQIEPNRGVQLLATPYLDKRSGNQYDFHIWNRIGEHVSLPLKVSTAAAIHVKKNGVIDKNRWILREKYDNSGPICNKVVGYLKSPFENRLAVLYVTEFLGYEGPPNVINFEWVGCLID